MNFFIKSTALEVFLAFVAVTFGSSLIANATGSPLVSGIAAVASTVVNSLWLATVAYTANARLPEELRISEQSIKIALVISNVAAAATFVGFAPELQATGEGATDSNTFVLLPLLSLMVGGLIYLAVLASKQLTAFEKARAVTFSEYWLTVLQFWFWYVGIWFLQPRIQQLAK